MPTQKEIAEHLGMNQSEVSRHMQALGIDWRNETMTRVRLAYIEHLRAMAAGHRAQDGTDLTYERAQTERVEREIKELTLAEKRGQLVNVAQIEAELNRMVVAFRTELMARDDKLIDDLFALYGVEVERAVLTEYTRDALNELARYDPGGPRADAATGGEGRAAAGDDDDRVGEGTAAPVGEERG